MFENLSKEILEKLKQAKSKEDALNILKENGITLTDEDLAGVAGGMLGCDVDKSHLFPGMPELCNQYDPHNCMFDYLR